MKQILKQTLLVLFVVIAMFTAVLTSAQEQERKRWGKHAKNPEFFRPAEMGNLPFSEAVAYRGVLYLSGQVGLGADGKLVGGGIEAESRQVMDNIVSVLKKHGLGFDRVIKCTVFLADIADWPAFNSVYTSYLDEDKLPARSALAASGLALGAAVELECMAALGPPTSGQARSK